jgi:hypothetical protein
MDQTDRHLRTLAGELAQQLPEDRGRALRVLRLMEEEIGNTTPRHFSLAAGFAALLAIGSSLAMVL